MAVISREDYHVWHPFTNMDHFFAQTVNFIKGEGTRLWDSEGREYLNLMSSLLNAHCGLGRPEIIEAVHKQMGELSYSTIERITNPAVIQLSKKLADLAPGNLNRAFFTNSGSEAVETVIKIVRQYAKITGKPEKYNIISLQNSYHGVSFGALSASGIEEIRAPYAPLLEGFIQIPPPYCYRCAFGEHFPGCGLECAAFLEKTIQEKGRDKIGGFLMEPVLGVSGVIIPPPAYFERVRSICREYEVFLIFDEIITGFGRIGSMFAAEHFGVSPDLMTLSKGINSGYLPLGATLATEDIYRAFVDAKGQDGVLQHGSTTGGHPASCASAIANIDVILKEGLVRNAKEMGDYFLSEMQRFYEYSIVGDIRGMGLLMAIELVLDRETKEPFSSDQMYLIAGRLLMSGIYAYYYKNNLFVAPPLIITKEEADYALDIYDRTLSKIQRVMS